MDEFSYLSILLSIILGLAVTQVLTGFRGLLQSRARVRVYWPTIAWACIALVICAQTWWAMFDLRAYHAWTFAGFAIVLFHLICLYMFAALVLPDFPPDQPVDLRAFYFAQHRWIGALVVVAACVSLSKDLVLHGRLPDRVNVVFHLVFIVAAGASAITRAEWFHKLLVLAISVLFALYIVLLFASLR
ncbi:MAG TPA: hypothetical protein VF551_08580 [Chthoniobacterales bacterium]|jgi:hypothetical protein